MKFQCDDEFLLYVLQGLRPGVAVSYTAPEGHVVYHWRESCEELRVTAHVGGRTSTRTIPKCVFTACKLPMRLKMLRGCSEHVLNQARGYSAADLRPARIKPHLVEAARQCGKTASVQAAMEFTRAMMEEPARGDDLRAATVSDLFAELREEVVTLRNLPSLPVDREHDEQCEHIAELVNQLHQLNALHPGQGEKSDHDHERRARALSTLRDAVFQLRRRLHTYADDRQAFPEWCICTDFTFLVKHLDLLEELC